MDFDTLELWKIQKGRLLSYLSDVDFEFDRRDSEGMWYVQKKTLLTVYISMK